MLKWLVLFTYMLLFCFFSAYLFQKFADLSVFVFHDVTFYWHRSCYCYAQFKFATFLGGSLKNLNKLARKAAVLSSVKKCNGVTYVVFFCVNVCGATRCELQTGNCLSVNEVFFCVLTFFPNALFDIVICHRLSSCMSYVVTHSRGAAWPILWLRNLRFRVYVGCLYFGVRVLYRIFYYIPPEIRKLPMKLLTSHPCPCFHTVHCTFFLDLSVMHFCRVFSDSFSSCVQVKKIFNKDVCGPIMGMNVRCSSPFYGSLSPYTWT